MYTDTTAAAAFIPLPGVADTDNILTTNSLATAAGGGFSPPCPLRGQGGPGGMGGPPGAPQQGQRDQGGGRRAPSPARRRRRAPAARTRPPRRTLNKTQILFLFADGARRKAQEAAAKLNKMEPRFCSAESRGSGPASGGAGRAPPETGRKILR